MAKKPVPLKLLFLLAILCLCFLTACEVPTDKGNSSQEHVHNYTSTILSEATCTEPGEKQFSCSCGDSYVEEIAALGHDYVGVVTEPTAAEDGYSTYTCSRCQDSYDADYQNNSESDTDSDANDEADSDSDTKTDTNAKPDIEQNELPVDIL